MATITSFPQPPSSLEKDDHKDIPGDAHSTVLEKGLNGPELSSTDGNLKRALSSRQISMSWFGERIGKLSLRSLGLQLLLEGQLGRVSS